MGKEIQLKIQWTRILCFGLLLFLILFQFFFEKEFISWNSLFWVGQLSFIGLANNIWLTWNHHKKYSKLHIITFSFLIDLVCINMMLIHSQLNIQIFLFLDFVTIFLSGLVLSIKPSLFLAAISSIFYSISTFYNIDLPTLSLVFTLAVNNVAFFIIAWVASQLHTTLKQNQKMKDELLAFSPVGLVFIDSELNVLTVNNQFSKMTRLHEDENLLDLQLWDSSILVDKINEKISFNYQQKMTVNEVEKVYYFNFKPYISENLHLLSIEDVTEIIVKENKNKENEKLAAIGRLAAGIAHEIRNPLAGISGSVELLSQNVSSEDDKKLMRIILREIDRLNLLISEFLDYAKPIKIELKKIIIAQLIQEAIFPVMQKYQGKIQFEIRATSAQFELDESKIKQAILNLVINATQAFLDENSNNKILISAEVNNQQLEVSIADNGIGIPIEIQSKIFEPFFTTKPKGTGLGLAVTYRILEAHRAAIKIVSDKGLGTKFVITFPTI